MVVVFVVCLFSSSFFLGVSLCVCVGGGGGDVFMIVVMVMMTMSVCKAHDSSSVR